MRKKHTFNAQGKVLGRLAVEIASVLSGKKKVDYVPNIDNGDAVIVLNADGVVVTGNKRKGKKYYRHSGFPGGIKEMTFEDMIKKDSRKVIYLAVRGMLPKNKLQAKMLKRLEIYKKEDDK